jgi:hypothetical protein
MSDSERRSILKLLLYIIYALAGLHFLALGFYLYWTFWWFDLLTHFLGGLWVGLAALWLIYFSGYIPKPALKSRTALYVAIGAIAGIGIIWELYEISLDVFLGIPIRPDYALDTAIDLVMDVLGALTGWAVFMVVARDRLVEMDESPVAAQESLHENPENAG